MSDPTLSCVFDPDGIDRYGPYYKTENVNLSVANDINHRESIYFKRRVKSMSKDLDAATETIKEAHKRFDDQLNKLLVSEGNIASQTKKISGKLKDTTNKLSDSLLRIDKIVNFDRLEKQVVLLERAERSIKALAELEASGRLDKIFSALR